MKAKLLLVGALAALVGVSIALQHMTNPEDQHKHQEEQPESPPPSMAVKQVITVKTNRGTFKFGLYESDMPRTCNHFAALAKKGFYKGSKFHRVEDWVVQTGDPKDKKTTNSVRNLPLEIKKGLGFERPYMVGMARGDDPNSATSQWFITKRPDPGLQTRGPYACFGEVFEGQKVIDSLKLGDVIEDLKVSKVNKKELTLLKKQQSIRPSPIPPPIPPVTQPIEKADTDKPTEQKDNKNNNKSQSLEEN